MYLTSLSLSDYRSRSVETSATVEALIDELRGTPLTFAGTLRLFEATAGAVDNSLFPPAGPLDIQPLRAASQLGSAIDVVKQAANDLPLEDVSTMSVEPHVVPAIIAPTKDVSWWTTWSYLVMYRNIVASETDQPWPSRGSRYYAVFNPLLEAAVVEILTYGAPAHSVLHYPVATLTSITEHPNGTIRHTLCGEAFGVWFETHIVDAKKVTDTWAQEDWQATARSNYILEEKNDGEFVIRALHWDLSKGPPPPPVIARSADRGIRALPARISRMVTGGTI